MAAKTNVPLGRAFVKKTPAYSLGVQGIYYLCLLYRYWWNTRIFLSTEKSYLHRAQWRYCFYLSRVRILVSPRLLTWLANYKRASRSGARPVVLKFHLQNGFEVRRRYSYRWLSRWAAKFSHRYFFRAWRTFRKICGSLGKWCWKIHWGGRKCKH